MGADGPLGWQALSDTKQEEGTLLSVPPHPLTGHRSRTFQPGRTLEPSPPALAAEFREGQGTAGATQLSWVSGDLWPSLGPFAPQNPLGGPDGETASPGGLPAPLLLLHILHNGSPVRSEGTSPVALPDTFRHRAERKKSI